MDIYMIEQRKDVMNTTVCSNYEFLTPFRSVFYNIIHDYTNHKYSHLYNQYGSKINMYCYQINTNQPK